MDYKKILKSRKLRLAILDVLSFVPDKPMIQLQYRIKTGRKLNLKNPQRYTEKLQWYKLYYRDPLMAQCVDKYEVRKYVTSLGLGHILNECYGVFDKPEDIDFDKLPNQFVLKDTLGGGGNSVIICKDKSKADLNSYISQMNEWVHTKVIPSGGREWVYYEHKKPHKIICEQLLVCDNGDLPDYKFYCFNGKCFVYYVREDYMQNHRNGKMAFFDNNNFQMRNLSLDYCVSSKQKILPPENIEQMKEISEKLAKRFPHVRVDLYFVNHNVCFGELTFFNASGYFNFEPDEFDYVLGERFILPYESKYYVLNKGALF